MAIDKKLAELIADEKDANKIASIVMSYNKAKAKEKSRLNMRRDFIKNYLQPVANKVNEGNLDAIAFEYAYANKEAFKSWLLSNKPDLFILKKKKKTKAVKNSEAGSDVSSEDTEAGLDVSSEDTESSDEV